MALGALPKPAESGSFRHFLDLDQVPAADLRRIIDNAAAVRAARQGRNHAEPDADAPLAGKMIALIFEKPSTRTRISFDLAARQLGGETMILTGAEMQLGRGESIADTARVLSRYVDAIMIRTFDPHTVEEMAAHASVPVINGLTDRSHPCQIMADVMTYEEKKGPIRGARVMWSGDGNNTAASFIHAAARFGFDLAVACPETLEPDAGIVAWARGEGARIDIERAPRTAAAGADAVVTDCWLSMHDSAESRERRQNLLRPYQVDAALMAAAQPDAIFMHCLPAHRNEEVASEVFDGPQSVVFDEAENRLHAQKGILRWCMGAL